MGAPKTPKICDSAFNLNGISTMAFIMTDRLRVIKAAVNLPRPGSRFSSLRTLNRPAPFGDMSHFCRAGDSRLADLEH